MGRPYTSQGIGKRLYCALIELLEKQGVKNVYGGVTLPNVKSEKLHLGLGFSAWEFTAGLGLSVASGTT